MNGNSGHIIILVLHNNLKKMIKSCFLLLAFLLHITAFSQLNYGIKWPLLQPANALDSNIALYKQQHVAVVIDSVYYKEEGKGRWIDKIRKSYIDKTGKVIALGELDRAAGVHNFWEYKYDKSNYVVEMSMSKIRYGDTLQQWTYKAIEYDNLKRPLVIHQHWTGNNTQQLLVAKISSNALWNYIGTEAAKSYDRKVATDNYIRYSYHADGKYTIRSIFVYNQDTMSVDIDTYNSKGDFVEHKYTFYNLNGTKGMVVWKDTNMRTTITETITWNKDSVIEHTYYDGAVDEIFGGIKAYKAGASINASFCTFIIKAGELCVIRPNQDEVKTGELWNPWIPISSYSTNTEKPINIIRIPSERGTTIISYIYKSESKTFSVLINAKGLQIFYKQKQKEILRQYRYHDTRIGKKNAKESSYIITSD
jgi:hypothetical protein